MNLKYQNTHSDFEVLYEERWALRKRQNRGTYYRQVLWYVAIVALGAYSSYTANMFFAVCIFGVLGVQYLWQNWSFQNHWKEQALSYAALNPECAIELSVDDSGIIEAFLGCKITVPWSQIKEFALTRDHVFIHFLSYRTFVVPKRYINEAEIGLLVNFLLNRGIKQSPNQALVPTPMSVTPPAGQESRQP